MKVIYKLEGLDCPVCASKMATAIAKIDGVIRVDVSFLMQKLTIEVNDGADLDAIVKEAQKRISRVDSECRIKV